MFTGKIMTATEVPHCKTFGVAFSWWVVLSRDIDNNITAAVFAAAGKGIFYFKTILIVDSTHQ